MEVFLLHKALKKILSQSSCAHPFFFARPFVLKWRIPVFINFWKYFLSKISNLGLVVSWTSVSCFFYLQRAKQRETNTCIIYIDVINFAHHSTWLKWERKKNRKEAHSASVLKTQRALRQNIFFFQPNWKCSMNENAPGSWDLFQCLVCAVKHNIVFSKILKVTANWWDCSL